MQLHTVSFQRVAHLPDEPISQIYKAEFLFYGGQPWFQAKVEGTSALLHYLEKNVVAPPQWVMTSHADPVFFPTDFELHSNELWHQQTMWIECSGQSPPFYEIHSHLLNVPGDISFVAGVRGVEAAGDFIGELLRGEVALRVEREKGV